RHPCRPGQRGLDPYGAELWLHRPRPPHLTEWGRPGALRPADPGAAGQRSTEVTVVCRPWLDTGRTGRARPSSHGGGPDRTARRVVQSCTGWIVPRNISRMTKLSA